MIFCRCCRWWWWWEKTEIFFHISPVFGSGQIGSVAGNANLIMKECLLLQEAPERFLSSFRTVQERNTYLPFSTFVLFLFCRFLVYFLFYYISFTKWNEIVGTTKCESGWKNAAFSCSRYKEKSIKSSVIPCLRI